MICVEFKQECHVIQIVIHLKICCKYFYFMQNFYNGVFLHCCTGTFTRGNYLSTTSATLIIALS